MEIHTIGFTQKSAREFFDLLKSAEIQRLVDVRLNNVSQLAAFAKRDDLQFFLEEILSAGYMHKPELAPETETLKAYRSGELEWSEYESIFLELMESRHIESSIAWDELLERRTVLLCSEPTAEHCHRRLVVEYLRRHGHELTPIHL